MVSGITALVAAAAFIAGQTPAALSAGHEVTIVRGRAKATSGAAIIA